MTPVIVLFVATGVGCFVLAGLEAVGVGFFFVPAYRFGLKAVVTQRPTVAALAVEVAARGKTDHAHYRVLGDLCLFGCTPMYSELSRHYASPLMLKGTISWRGGVLTIIGRYPVGAPTLSAYVIVVFLTVAADLFAVHQPVLACLSGSLAVGLCTFLVLVRPHELRRFHLCAAEVLARLEESALDS